MLNKSLRFFDWSKDKKYRYISSLLARYYFYITLKFRLKKCGAYSIIKNPLYITPEFISLGMNVHVMDGCRIEAISSYSDKKFNPEIILEDGVSVEQRCHITAAGKLVIEENSVISYNVSIQDTDHEYRHINVPVAKQELITRETRIGRNCFIGSGARIQAGTILGMQCIVGANAVVRGIFPDYCVIVGIPGRIIKRYNLSTKRWEKVDDKGNFLIGI